MVESVGNIREPVKHRRCVDVDEDDLDEKFEEEGSDRKQYKILDFIIFPTHFSCYLTEFCIYIFCPVIE